MNEDHDHDPLLDDDEVVDFLLYERMSQEPPPRPGSGCLGVLALCLAPAGLLLLVGLL